MGSWTNVHNLPAPLASAVRNDTYKSTGDISVTALIKPPQMRALEKEHAGEIVQDVVDGIWRLLGQAVHAVLERADTSNHFSEERLVVEVDGCKLSGQVDLLDNDEVLSDYKVTSVYAFILSDKPEWEQQLNIYGWMYRKHGFAVRKLQIVAILRDFMASKAGQDGYPEVQVQVVEIPMWDDAKVESFVKERIALHRAAAKVECTPHERWERPATYAVMKDGAKRAKRVFESKATADSLLAELGKGHSVVVRPGENVRCARFCAVAKWCPTAKRLGIHPEAIAA